MHILNQDDSTRLILIYELASVFLQAEQRDTRSERGEEIPMPAPAGISGSAAGESLPAASGAEASTVQGGTAGNAVRHGRAARSRPATARRRLGKNGRH